MGLGGFGGGAGMNTSATGGSRDSHADIQQPSREDLTWQQLPEEVAMNPTLLARGFRALHHPQGLGREDEDGPT